MAEATTTPTETDAEKFAIAPAQGIIFAYRNYRGEIGERRVQVLGMRWGSSEYHPEPQWLMTGYDLDKGAQREFAVKDMAPDIAALSSTSAPVGEAEEVLPCEVIVAPCTRFGKGVKLSTVIMAIRRRAGMDVGPVSAAAARDPFIKGWIADQYEKGALDPIAALSSPLQRGGGK